MSIGRAGDELLFAKIGDKKISGSDVAGYYGEQTVFRTEYFSCFLIVS